jgi:predicted Zn finger-like uncharacterized protein
MHTRCPQCRTVYSVDQEHLRADQGMLRCFNCDNLFNAWENDTHASDLDDWDDFELASSDLHRESDRQAMGEEPVELELPFDVPDDLPVLEPSADAALDAQYALAPSRRRPSPWWQILLAALLLLLLALQLAWFNRAQLLQLPQARPVCQWIDCSRVQARDPAAFEVLSRQLQADPTVPGALRLLLRFRNAADAAQPLPLLQLALFDNGGAVLARRSFQPGEYLFPPPPQDRLATPQEVFTIELIFEDPGARASGFMIDFL